MDSNLGSAYPCYKFNHYFPWSIWPTIVTTGGLGTRSFILGGLWTTSKLTSSSDLSLGLCPTILNLHPNLVAMKVRMWRFPRGSCSELIVHLSWNNFVCCYTPLHIPNNHLIFSLLPFLQYKIKTIIFQTLKVFYKHLSAFVVEPVIRMSPVKMTVGSKYSKISPGPIGKLLFLPC